MEAIEAKILLKNLLKRVRKINDDAYELNGQLTDDEVAALDLALQALSDFEQVQSATPSDSSTGHQPFDTGAAGYEVDDLTSVSETKFRENANKEMGKKDAEGKIEELPREPVKLDTSTLELPSPPENIRLCLDFGTAMSKVTLVRDQTPDRGYEDIEVLKLGVPGDQEEISETMLVSSVFIDGEGILWFGQMAVQRSQLEGRDGERQRLDNIKRYLSEEGLGSEVSEKFNPTAQTITYGDMVLAYLMFFTWTINHCLENIDEPRNLNRRFAMPCFGGSKARDATRVLSTMLGEAQVLADTFFSSLQDGIPLEFFMDAVNQIRSRKRSYDFIKEDITEPLGVAGAIMSWEQPVNSLVMVVDVGAGTSDFSLYRLHFDDKSGKSFALEVENSSEGVTEAGNYLDMLLKGLILREAGVDSAHPHWINIQGNLALDLRDYKERLFIDGDVVVRLFNDQLVNVSLDQFLALPQVSKFGESLRECRDRILNRVDISFIRGAPHGALAVALTGGGASLPMVKDLARGATAAQGSELKLVQTKAFPQWIADEFPDLEDDYPRVAVSLGGAREKIITRGGVAKITAGDVKGTPELGGYYTRG